MEYYTATIKKVNTNPSYLIKKGRFFFFFYLKCTKEKDGKIRYFAEDKMGIKLDK